MISEDGKQYELNSVDDVLELIFNKYESDVYARCKNIINSLEIDVESLNEQVKDLEIENEMYLDSNRELHEEIDYLHSQDFL